MIETYLQHLHIPEPGSHKSQNGKTLIIGGSDLFHAASQWSFRVVSRIVDMTFYSSVAENNKLLRDAKFYGHDGVIVPRSELASYADEVDSVLIGPGLRRDTPSRFLPEELLRLRPEDLSPEDWESDAVALVSTLLRSFPDKQWVLDAGALQVLRPEWIPGGRSGRGRGSRGGSGGYGGGAMLTPHKGEFVQLLHRWGEQDESGKSSKISEQARKTEKAWEQIEAGLEEMAEAYFQGEDSIEPLLVDQSIIERFIRRTDMDTLRQLAQLATDSTWIVKGQADLIWNGGECVAVVGGNAGLTKGGTGDVLAGLIAGFAAQSDSFPSVVVSSYLNKMAGHELFQDRKTMYNTSDLVERLPLVWGKLL